MLQAVRRGQIARRDTAGGDDPVFLSHAKALNGTPNYVVLCSGSSFLGKSLDRQAAAFRSKYKAEVDVLRKITGMAMQMGSSLNIVAVYASDFKVPKPAKVCHPPLQSRTISFKTTQADASMLILKSCRLTTEETTPPCPLYLHLISLAPLVYKRTHKLLGWQRLSPPSGSCSSRTFTSAISPT